MLPVSSVPEFPAADLAARSAPTMSEPLMPNPSALTGAYAEDPDPVVPLSDLKRRAIANALAFTKGDRALAAQLLGVGRTTLYRKVKEYRLGAA
jgi:transcriptional regulator of acetoin/glycerol metabolism